MDLQRDIKKYVFKNKQTNPNIAYSTKYDILLLWNTCTKQSFHDLWCLLFAYLSPVMKGIYAVALRLKVGSYLVSTVYQLIKGAMFDLQILQEKDFVC